MPPGVYGSFFWECRPFRATLPIGNGGAWQSFGLETLLTFFLMIVIMAMATDTRAVGQAAALATGATVGLEALSARPFCGASMNPALLHQRPQIFGKTTSIWSLIWPQRCVSSKA